MVKVKPLDILGKEEVKALEQDVIEKLLQVAVARTGVPREQWVVRDILPKTDLGLTNEKWAFDYSTANDWNPVINQQLPDRKFVIFFKVVVLDPAPVATAIRFKKGVKVKDVLEIEDLFVKKEPEGYLEEPIIYEENDTITIDIYATATKTGERIVLAGYVAELKGETITE